MMKEPAGRLSIFSWRAFTSLPMFLFGRPSGRTIGNTSSSVSARKIRRLSIFRIFSMIFFMV
ncbi:MAG: hypothetical protein A2X31_11725 [Elusimicrobia bacterium GWB2_63_22]|nr:MAG: hypothetical protein A2X31_11725 [Elusimicrobia bacterium GWB2_63_22]